MLTEAILKPFYRRYLQWRLPELVGPENYPVILEFPIDPKPRFGYDKAPHPRLVDIISANARNYAESLNSFVDYGEAFSEIAKSREADGFEPTFFNTKFHGLDAIALYGFLAKRNPVTLFEIGSGNSTRFARRAIKDHGLRTRIVSCDPQPRVEIDTISDEIIRQPFESIDLSILETLQDGDILFIDSSHRCFQNSDVTVQFLEVIPDLKPGVLVHIHDIFLPHDYPPSWSKRHYNEQYLLASFLLGGGGDYEVIMPNAYVSAEENIAAHLDPLWQFPMMDTVLSHAKELQNGFLGLSFWMKKTG